MENKNHHAVSLLIPYIVPEIGAYISGSMPELAHFDMKYCRICEKEIEQGRYCSVACANEAVSIVRRWQRKSQYAQYGCIAACPVCGLLFVKTEKKQVYCSKCGAERQKAGVERVV